MDKPTFVSLQIVNSCNLNCMQCDYHMENRHPQQLTVQQQCEVVRQIADWSTDIRLKFTGGEPFVDKARLFAVLEEAHRHGLVTFFLTNATLIQPDDIHRMFDLDLGCISVSLDSHVSAIHDAMRGIQGCWNQVASFLDDFTQIRRQRQASTQLWASTILTRNNLGCIEELVRSYEELGFDAIKFQPLYPNYRRLYKDNWKSDSPLYPTRDEVECGFDQLLELKQTHPVISQSEDHIEKMRTYFLSESCDSTIRCGIMDRVMIIGCEGSVRFCFQQDPTMQCCEVMPDRDWNVRSTDLKTIWSESHALRQEMKRGCHQPCGLLWDRVRDIVR